MVMGAMDLEQLLMMKILDFWHFAHAWWIAL
jgi:heme O synthase-like polyprenyltransferase